MLALGLAGCATSPRHPANNPNSQPSLAASATPPGAAARRSRFVAGATAMLGQPYRWGGAAPGGFDCSGLVAYAAASAGLELPRTAAAQLHTGRRIERREVRAGDLVFMRLARKELHVGIAIDGDRFVDAPASGGRVRIDSLGSPRYARGYLEARRVIDD